MTPSVCSAKTTVWNMEGVPKLEGWNHKNFTSIGLTEQGLSIATDTQGQLARAGNIHHTVDTISITYSSANGANGIFFWQAKGMEGNSAYHIPISFQSSATPTTMQLDLSRIPEWSANSKLIGFNFNAGSQIILQRIELSGPGLIDKIIYPVQSFFTLDRVHAYTVNFLWGPRIVYNPEQVARVFSEVPPLGGSWNSVLYALLFLMLIVALAFRWKTGRSTMHMLVMVFALLWIIYDLRMGAEVLSYANTDRTTWWNQPNELKDFRDRGSFTAFTKIFPSYLQEGENRYVLAVPNGWPYFTAMQYESYPAIPVGHKEDVEGIDLWAVFDMPGIRVDEQGRIEIDGTPVSPPGKIVLQYEPGAFIFRVAK